MKSRTMLQYAAIGGVALFHLGTARVLKNPIQIFQRRETISPFYPATLEDLTLVRAAYDELGNSIKAKLYRPSPECLPMATDKVEGMGSRCPFRDQILVDIIREAFRQLTVRFPRLRDGIAATPPAGVSPVSWKDFNDNYSKLDGAITFALREIEKQACYILADTKSQSYDAVYGGSKTPATIKGTPITVTSLQDSVVQFDFILENGISPRRLDEPAQFTTEDYFGKVKATRELFVVLGGINDVQSLSTGAQRCVSLLAEFAGTGLLDGLGGILTGSGAGGLPPLPKLPGLGR
ncbi:hypothetical protein TWF481_003564 [Arthrobotrys musiformis]|uniref:Uncharacterized protein n=1 Tax=Arthrobotrys musiformis TaxID=47236 RepID=A0AAV9WIY4_9PEZI